MPPAPTCPPAALRTRCRVGRLVAFVVLLAILAGVGIGPGASAATAAPAPSQAEGDFVNRINAERRNRGLAPLYINDALASTSRTWSAHLRAAGGLSHDPNLAAIVGHVVPDWRRAGENVGVGYTVSSLHNAFMASSGHRANILGDYNQVGIGVVVGSDGRIWVTVRFVKGSVPAGAKTSATRPDRIGVRRGSTNLLRSSLSSGPATTSYGYGATSDVAVVGDWDGNGTSTPGVFRNGMWYLRNSNSAGDAQITASFGSPGDIPIVGDWNGDGRDTIGTWRGGTARLRNSNTSGGANVTFTYGQSGDVPLTGDWNGDGVDTIGVHRAATFLLRNSNSSGGASSSFGYGVGTDVPVVGDWDGNQTDTVGIRRGNGFYLRNANSGGSPSVSFNYGDVSDEVVVGSW